MFECPTCAKLDNYTETTSNFNTDDGEGLSKIKAESSVKAETKAEPIKEEPTIEEGTEDSRAFTGTFQHPANNTMDFHGANDGSVQHLMQICDVAEALLELLGRVVLTLSAETTLR